MATDDRSREDRHGLVDDPLPAATSGTPLYVHLPFCAAKCHYCDFFSVASAGQDIDGMLSAVLAEARQHVPQRPRTVFLGGGTPSLLSVGQLRRLLDELHALSGFRDSALEVTAECNPESLDFDKARALLDLGVTRLSIGFQSFDDATLALFGRVHSVDDSFRAFDAARRAGAARINVDLIFGAPGQTEASWRADLERVCALGPEHIAAYNLTYEEATPFRRWRDQGRLESAPEELELALFCATRGVLAAACYEAYEVSNFARSGHQCHHNVNYWRNGDYLGIGPSAVSRSQAVRAGNLRSIHEYRAAVHAHGHARHWSEAPDARTRLAETWWLGLRMAEGLSPSEARERATFDPARGDDDAGFLELADDFAAYGLLERAGDRLRLSARGLPLADGVARKFLALARELAVRGHAPSL